MAAHGRNFQRRRTSRWRCATMVAMLSCMGIAQAGPSQGPVSSEMPMPLLSMERRVAIERELTGLINDYINKYGIRGKLPLPLSVRVTLEAATEEVVVDLGAAMGAEEYNLDAEDLRTSLDYTIRECLNGRLHIEGTRFLYDGKDFDYYSRTLSN